MTQRNGIIRLVSVFTVTLIVFGYNIYNGINFSGIRVTEDISSDSSEAVLPYFSFSSGSEVKEESKTEISENKSESQESASVPASAKENIKGKIIEKYISPYSAGLSYNHVYLKNSTKKSIDIKALLGSKLGFKLSKKGEPQVLIMHTHTTEAFMTEDKDYFTDGFSSRTRDQNKNMVEIGEIIEKKLNGAGIKTIHDKTEHDYPQYTGSYSRAAKTINSYLKKYPSIKIVLDLHRDAVSSGNDKVKLTTEINGKKAAQVMLVMGSEAEGISHPKWKENLKLAVRLQQTMEVSYPTLARPILLMPKKYNQHLTTGSLLLEFGTDVNTLEEVKYSAELVGGSLVSLFNTLT